MLCQAADAATSSPSAGAHHAGRGLARGRAPRPTTGTDDGRQADEAGTSSAPHRAGGPAPGRGRRGVPAPAHRGGADDGHRAEDAAPADDGHQLGAAAPGPTTRTGPTTAGAPADDAAPGPRTGTSSPRRADDAGTSSAHQLAAAPARGRAPARQARRADDGRRTGPTMVLGPSTRGPRTRTSSRGASPAGAVSRPGFRRRESTARPGSRCRRSRRPAHRCGMCGRS